MFFNQVIIRTFIAKRDTNLNHAISGLFSHTQIKIAVPDRFPQNSLVEVFSVSTSENLRKINLGLILITNFSSYTLG